MGIEIERKFLLRSDAWRAQVHRSTYLEQAYLGGSKCSIRLRCDDHNAWINIKSKELGSTRAEYEYALPLAEAREMMQRFADGAAICKTRHLVSVGEALFEIDEFGGANAGLIVAEIELASADSDFPRPDWLGEEVTDQAHYYNSNLVANPYSAWPK